MVSYEYNPPRSSAIPMIIVNLEPVYIAVCSNLYKLSS